MAADRKAAYLEAAGVALLSGVMFSGARDLEHYISHSDLGYQLSLGRHLLLGKKPFVDFFFLYGPLTGYTSALGLWLTNGVIGEVVICSLGYALSVSCLYYAVSRAWGRASLASRAGGLVVVFVALNLMSRFFKWYYWLFPLATLLCLRRAVLLVAKERPADRALLAAGFVAGVGGLYRLDLGLACVFSVCAIALLSGLRSRNPRAASVAVLTVLHLDQVPASSTLTTGISAPRVLGRLTPGSPQAWQRLRNHLSDNRPAKISLRSARPTATVRCFLMTLSCVLCDMNKPP